MYTVGTTSLSNVAINNNTATSGGGIYNAVQKTSDDKVVGRGQLTLNGVSFSGNKADQGGAIYNAGTLTMKGTNTFSGNTAAEGKDIFNRGTLNMGAGSHLFVDGNKNIHNTGTLNVADGAKLTITDAVAGGNYEVVTGTGSFNNQGWKGDNVQASSDMVALTSTDGGKTFTAENRDAHDVFTGLDDSMGDAVNSLYARRMGPDGRIGNYADVNAREGGIRFLSRATDNRFLGSDKDAAAATIESAARIAFAGAVPQMTKMASDAGSNAVVNRLGFANPADGAQAMNAEGKIVDRNTTGFALWIAPLWQSQHGWGMEADNLDYGFNGNLGGVSLGADYTFENAIRAGITFNIGGGYAESSGGDLNSTENRMSFWGLGAYAGWNYENFGLMADVSYTSTWNDLQQDMDSRMGMGDLEADVQASAISAGLRAEYKLETSVLDVIPHIGVRYMSLNTWGFDAESNGGTVLEGDGFHQDIWTFPVGVTFTKDFTLDSGWSFKPSIDFSVIPAAGDIKAKQDVAFTGLPGSYEVETQMMDYLTWQGGVGLEMGNDTMSFGVNYTLQAGQHTTGHGVFGSFRYEF
ncbi:autotransporter family protein [Desulfovibrio piger]|uniref:autotransporter family protein n=1 Tax=Desulfovibrio piger TaxID=901 RepID=UPI0026E92038|nr:autotransporter outer membrane beta-barrel domain-containing protein [Desulfovibrio piger]